MPMTTIILTASGNASSQTKAWTSIKLLNKKLKSNNKISTKFLFGGLLFLVKKGNYTLQIAKISNFYIAHCFKAFERKRIILSLTRKIILIIYHSQKFNRKFDPSSL